MSVSLEVYSINATLLRPRFWPLRLIKVQRGSGYLRMTCFCSWRFVHLTSSRVLPRCVVMLVSCDLETYRQYDNDMDGADLHIKWKT